jgi:hypothetical protein
MVLMNLLSEGQYARVLQLPVLRQERNVNANAEKAAIFNASLESIV